MNPAWLLGVACQLTPTAPVVAPGAAPSAAQPQGTAYVGAAKVVEWDLATQQPVHAFEHAARAIDVDDQRVAVLDLDASGILEVSVLDRALRPLVHAPTGRGDANGVVLSRGGRVAVVTSFWGFASARQLMIDVFGAKLEPVTSRRFDTVDPRELDPQQVVHVGDSFYALQLNRAKAATYVVRLDDRTLRERARSAALAGAAKASLHVEEGKLVVSGEPTLSVLDAELHLEQQVPVASKGRAAWSSQRTLTSERCTPSFMHAQPRLFCAGNPVSVQPAP